MKKRQDIILVLILLFSFASVLFSRSASKQTNRIRKEWSELKREFSGEENEESPSKATPALNTLGCKKLKSVPFAEDLGIVKRIRTLKIDGAKAPYNGAILERGDGYLLVFRYDVKSRKKFFGITTPLREKIPFHTQRFPYKSFIGAVSLDRDFRQISEVRRIDTGSEFSEDPRIFTANGKLYLSYNDVQENEVFSRSMRLAELDPDTLQPVFISDIDQHISRVEKNWVPFTRRGADGTDIIHFGYGINPRKVLIMADPKSNRMEHPVCPHTSALQKMPWSEKKWGELRGGTPPAPVDGRYLAFFHTLFYEKKIPWYVMGAYTFEAAPPYRVTAISKEPILFRGIYETPAANTAHSKKRVIYPAGLSLGFEEGKEVIHLSCGENDSINKILTLDKEALLSSLVPVVPYTPAGR